MIAPSKNSLSKDPDVITQGNVAPLSEPGKSPRSFPTQVGLGGTHRAVQAGSNRGQQYHTNGFIKLIANGQGENRFPHSSRARFIPFLPTSPGGPAGSPRLHQSWWCGQERGICRVGALGASRADFFPSVPDPELPSPPVWPRTQPASASPPAAHYSNNKMHSV